MYIQDSINYDIRKINKNEIKPIGDFSLNINSDENNTNSHNAKSDQDTILNLDTVDNPIHNSSLLKINNKYDFDKRNLFR